MTGSVSRALDHREGRGQSIATVRRLRTDELEPDQLAEIRVLLEAAFSGSGEGDLTEEDWQHTLGGTHFLLEANGSQVGHAAVVERRLDVGGRPVRTGYVEAVAIHPDHQRQGFGSRLMQHVNAFIREHFELGVLGTGSIGFYERLGWQVWQGPTGVRTSTGFERTPDEDGYVLVLRTPASPPMSLAEPISVEWRPGDAW